MKRTILLALSFSTILIGIATTSLALKPGEKPKQPADRYWQIVFEPKFATKNGTVEFWRTHTSGDIVEISKACDDKGGVSKATAKGNKDDGWSLGGDYGDLAGKIDKSGTLTLSLKGESYAKGQRIAPVTCDKKTGLPEKIVMLEVASGEMTLAAQDVTNLDKARGIALPTVRTPAAPEPIPLPASTSTLANGDTYKCVNSRVPLAEVRQLGGVPMLGTNAGIWPGALIQGKAYATGSVSPITIGRSGGTVNITNVNFERGAKTSTDLDVMSEGKVEEAVKKVLSQKVISTESNFDFRVEEVFNDDQLAYSFGVDGRFLFGLNNTIRVDATSGKSNVLLRFKQTYYVASFEDPESATDVFRDDTMFKDPENQIGPDNPPLYVKSVGYGRVIMFLVTSPYEGKAVVTALQNAKEGKPDGTAMSGGVPVSFSQILNGSTVSYSVQGGDQIASLGKMGTITGVKNMYEAIKSTITDPKLSQVTELSRGVPVNYTLSYLTSRQTASLGFSTAYSMKSCSTVPKKYASFNATITCIDDYAYVSVIDPAGKETPVTQGGGAINFDMFIPTVNQPYIIRFREYNTAGPSCLHFTFERHMPNESGAVVNSQLNNGTGQMQGSPALVTLAGSWGVGWLVDYRIRVNRFTGDVAVTQGR